MLACLLPLAGVALPSGRWLDAVGRRPALGFSLSGFALAGVAAGLAWLIGARLVRGSFGALLFWRLQPTRHLRYRVTARRARNHD